MKKYGLTTLAVLVVWAITDYIIHSVLLMGAYEATQELWRPMGEMKMWLIYVVELITIVVLIYLYDKMIAGKSLMTGLKFGVLYGIAAGVGMGYGTYAVQPLPYSLALTWFLGTVVQAALAGLIIGALVKD